MELVERYEQVGAYYILITEEILNRWREPYIPLLEDMSNWEEYWNQPLEAHARQMAAYFTGVTY